MIEIKLRLFAITNLISVDVHVDVRCFAHYFESRIYCDWLTYTQVVDGVMAVWDSFDVDECFAPQVWFVVVAFDGGHAVFV